MVWYIAILKAYPSPDWHICTFIFNFFTLTLTTTYTLFIVLSFLRWLLMFIGTKKSTNMLINENTDNNMVTDMKATSVVNTGVNILYPTTVNIDKPKMKSLEILVIILSIAGGLSALSIVLCIVGIVVCRKCRKNEEDKIRRHRFFKAIRNPVLVR